MSESKRIIDMLNHLIMDDDDTVSDYWESYLQQTIMHIESLQAQVAEYKDTANSLDELYVREVKKNAELQKQVAALEAAIERLGSKEYMRDGDYAAEYYARIEYARAALKQEVSDE